MNVLRDYSGTGADGRLDRATLVCCPHAGGAASFFAPWRPALGTGARIWAAKYPGREDRYGERNAASLAAIATEIADAVRELKPDDGPLVIFGHSMGAKVAYEVAHALSATGPTPDLLTVSAMPPARARTTLTARAYDASGSADLATQLLALDSGFAEVAQHPELLQYALRLVSADLDVLTAHQLTPGPLDGVPILALAATDDPTDAPAQMDAWRDWTTGPTTRRDFAGDHFYLRGLDGGQLVADAIAQALRQ